MPGERQADRISTVLAALALGVLVLGLVASAASRATMAFGDSHDGRNAGVWAAHSRALRENGPIESRLGTRSIVGDRVVPYATHPPLIGVEAAIAETVLGERTWATRLPAWAGSLAAVVLAFLLLRACRLRPVAASVGVALGFGCPMFAVYGTMLDTAMVGLPFGIAVLLLWQRARIGRPAPAPVVILVSVLAALTSWLGLLTAVLVAGATLLPRVRRRWHRPKVAAGAGESEDVPSATGFVAGAILGAAVVLAWIAWAYGSLQPLADQFLVRSGTEGPNVGLPVVVGSLEHYWSELFMPWQLLLAVPALVAAVQRRASQPVALVLVAAMGMWLGGLRSGTVNHDYWAYWMVVPLALGIGVMADAALTALQRRPGPGGGRLVLQIALAGCSAGLALAGALNPNLAGAASARGAPGGALIRAASYPPSQRIAWYLGDNVVPFEWITYNSRLPALELRTAEDVSRLAAVAPAELVFVNGARLRHDVRATGPHPGCRAGVPDGQTFSVLPAGVLAANLTRASSGCPAT